MSTIQFCSSKFFLTLLFGCAENVYCFAFREVTLDHPKVTLDDVICSTGECLATFSGFTWFSLMLSALFWAFRLIKVLYHIVQYWDIKKFFNTALKIDDVSCVLVVIKIRLASCKIISE